jgi:hypothetical protein
VDIEDLKQSLAQALVASSQGEFYLGIEGLANELETLGRSYRVHAEAIRSSTADPERLKVEIALVLDKLEKPS